MTICAGFVTYEGILLCADSQYTGWEKTYDTKLYSRPVGGFTLSFGFAGSVDHAKSIIEDCWEAAEEIASETIVKNIRKKLHGVMNEGWSQIPEGTERPEFLVGITTQKESHLFSYRNKAMPRVEKCELLGSGSYIAHHVMQSLNPMRMDNMNLFEAALVGISILAAATRTDANCGGGSQFLAVSHLSSINLGPNRTEASQDLLEEYEFLARNFFISVGDYSLSDQEFHVSCQEFQKGIAALRRKVQDPKSGLRAILESVIQVARPNRPSPTSGQLPPQPLPESRGGSDEP
jgi:hypothetical protein